MKPIKIRRGYWAPAAKGRSKTEGGWTAYLRTGARAWFGTLTEAQNHAKQNGAAGNWARSYHYFNAGGRRVKTRQYDDVPPTGE